MKYEYDKFSKKTYSQQSKSKKKIDIKKLLLYICFILALLVGYFFSDSYNVNFNYDAESLKKDQPLHLNIQIYEGIAKSSPPKVELEFSHIYNNNEYTFFELEPLSNGDYDVILLPSLPGSYELKLTITDDKGTPHFFIESIEI